MSSVESDVVDAARYLRPIRPIDPEELVDYLTASTTPATVREILRSRAFELELIERRDGLFVPADTDPIEHRPTTIERLPDPFCDLVHEVLVDRFGEGWGSGRSGERIRRRIRELKQRYLEGGEISYDRLDAVAYLLYHSPRSYAATRYVIEELTERELLVPPLRILDVGAGTGGQLAAFADVVDEQTLVAYEAVEPSPLAEICERVAEEYVGRNVHVTIERESIESISLEADYDLLFMGNVLSELEDPFTVAARTFDGVEQSGTWVATAPSDPRTSTQLFAIERSLIPPATVYAPMIRLWPGREPHDEAWSFVEQRPIEPPSFQRTIQSSVPEDERDQYTTRTIRYSYTILRRDDTRRYEMEGDPERYRPLGDIESSVGNRIDLLAVKLSADLSDRDGNPLFRLGDGSQRKDCFGVCVKRTTLNEPLVQAPYGAIISLEQGLVLWNADEEAINVIIDEQTIIDQLAP